MNLRSTIAAAGIAALTLTGCLATTADLRAVAGTIDDMNAGFITQEQAVAELEAKADEIDARSLKVPASLPEAFVQLLTIGGALGGTAYAGKRWTNRERDARRKDLGPAYKVVKPGVVEPEAH